MASADFMYENKLRTCPITEEQANTILAWIGINKTDAEAYSGISSSRAILAHATEDYIKHLYPPHYQSIQGRE
jgi:hypothetical protein